jgi:eukaryotic-like serine/threonine-protein kinase
VLRDVPGHEVFAYLGGGGFGDVFAARTRDHHEVAIKIALDQPEARARLAAERELLQRIGPPWVPRLLGAGRLDDGSPYLVMERITVPTLAHRMAELEGPLAPAEIARWLAPVLAAVHALHDRGVVHRDLKPENLFVDDTRAVVVDFGLARAESDPDLTATGAGPGSAVYIAPEQVAGRPATPAADVYALGVILYELAAARPPFFGDDAEIRSAHLSRRPPAPSERAASAAPLDALALACLAKDPTRRPSLGEVASWLADASAHPVAGSPGTLPVLRGVRARVWCGVLAFDAGGDPEAVARTIAEHRGILIGAAHGVWTAAFAAADGPRPLARAHQAAQVLITTGLARRCLVDRRELVLRTRDDGARHVITPIHAVADRLRGCATPGIQLSEAARAAGDATRSQPGASTNATGPPIPGECSGTPGDSGRGVVVAELLSRARRAIVETTAARCTIIGAPGVGRTWLARRLAAELEVALPGARIVPIDVRFEPGGALASVTAAIANTLVDLAPFVSRGDLPSSELSAEVDATVEANDRAALAHALGRPDARDVAANVAVIERLRETPGAYRGAVARALAAALVRGAARRPTVVIVDDAHHAPPAILDALRLATQTGRAPLWCALLARRPLYDEPGDPRAELGPLDRDAAVALCRTLLAPAIDVPDAALERLVARAACVPRELVHLCRALHATGAIRARWRGGDHYLDTDALDDHLRPSDGDDPRELAGLDPALRAHGAALALLVPGFTADDAEGVFDRLHRSGSHATFPYDTGVVLERLCARGIVEVTASTWQIATEPVRDALRAGLPDDLIRRIHLAAAAHFDARVADEPGAPELLARLAPHLIAIGDATRAAQITLALADANRATHAYVAAESLYARALELGEAALEPGARRGRAEMRYRLGRYEDALADWARCRELAREDAALEAELLLDEATALDWMGDRVRSGERVAAARALAGAEPAPRLQVRLLVAEARSLWRLRGADAEADAVATLEHALEVVEQLEREAGSFDPTVIVRAPYEDAIVALVMLVFLLPSRRRLEDAERIADRAIAICERHGDRLHLVATLNNRQRVSIETGRYARAIADLERADRIGLELGLPARRYVPQLGLADLHRRRGDWPSARVHAERARAIETAGSAAGLQQSAAVQLVAILAALGELDAARGLLGGIARDPLHPVERALVDAMALVLGVDEGSWEPVLRGLAERAGTLLPEVLAQRALAAARAGDVAEAARLRAEAIEAARAHDPVMLDRLRRATVAEPTEEAAVAPARGPE